MKRYKYPMLVSALALIFACGTCAVLSVTGPWIIGERGSVIQNMRTAFAPMLTQYSEKPFDAQTVVRADLVETRTTRNNSLPIPNLFDDDSTYPLSLLYEVEYADSSIARVEWRSWRYGLVLGPVVVSQGDGPPGSVHPLAMP